MHKPSLLERLRAKKQSPRPALGLAWYDEANWAMVKATALDPHRFENSFAEWLAMATQTLDHLKRSGADATPVHIVAAELIAWCRACRRQNDAAARAAYVAARMRVPKEPGQPLP
jgi:alpha-beta hydrolase superfamily lysophospholipase